jgi:radical SAM/Cys-rich protein
MNPELALQEMGVEERPLETFRQTLAKQALKLERGKTTTLQINVGLLCNQSCRHCHLDAGPHRPENMSAQTAQEVIAASFPSTNEAQADSQRGRGIFQTSLDTLRKLNAMGYGQDGTGLELDLVSNPTGAFLPTPQGQMEQRFREILTKKWGIVFNHLYSFANAPLGRFRQWLLQSENLESYLQRLASSFNPCAVEGLMCRTLVSVSWDGILYDCDFNLARDLPMGGRRTHVSRMEGPPEPGSPIAVGDHCYTCTAGAGFT